jgi:hypothetical protein
MGWVETRINQQGSIRYVAKYRDIRGRKQTAGTFGEEKPAKQAWQDAEAKVREGRGQVLVRGKQQFEPYVRGTWFPNNPPCTQSLLEARRRQQARLLCGTPEGIRRVLVGVVCRA